MSSTTLIRRILVALGLSPSDSDLRLKDLVSRTYSTVSVVGRGTVIIDPNEVSNSTEFRQARIKAKAVVDNS